MEPDVSWQYSIRIWLTHRVMDNSQTLQLARRGGCGDTQKANVAPRSAAGVHRCGSSGRRTFMNGAWNDHVRIAAHR